MVSAVSSGGEAVGVIGFCYLFARPCLSPRAPAGGIPVGRFGASDGMQRGFPQKGAGG